MPSYDACLVESELRARSAYADSRRHYHDQRHLDDCLDKLDRVTGLREGERRLLKWAILWHDAIYEADQSDNEDRSADLAYRELRACGVEEADAAEVARLIQLTTGHRAESNDRLGALLVSIDLSILGADAERYRAYVDDVRREYAHLPDDAWRAGRAAVLKHLLAADPLYPDALFRTALETQARGNMADELKALGAG